ncbi:MAG: hypothetical protein JWM10_4566 [Myxococcaceae bacterium]|nr:hypothetical protein [Myxococcaceae bacterium]
MPDDPTTPATLRCPRCDAALTAPVSPLPDARLVEPDGWNPRVPQGAWARVDAVASGGAWEAGAYPIHVHPHDLALASLAVSGFGCCGYAPFGRPNLHCRCGAPVGVFVDECSWRLEARLGARWSPAHDAPPRDADVTRRLDRLADARLADPRVFPDTRWDWNERELDRRLSPREAAFSLDDDADGLCARALLDGESIALPWSSGELARAVALRRLPVGAEALALAYGLRDGGNRVLSAWGLVRRGSDVDLVVEEGPRSRAWRVWGEWMQLAWAEAVDRWMASPRG